MTATMVLEFDERPPSMNGGHGNRHAKATMKRHWRELGKITMLQVRNQAGVWRAGSIAVTAQQLSRNRAGLQDLGNCHEAVKAVIDGIVDTGFIPDDRFEHVTSLTYVGPDVCGRDGLRLTIRYTPR